MNIKAHREQKHMTQLELARNVEVTQSTISQFETGAREPSLVILKKISELFNCTIDELVKGGEENG